MLNNAMAVERAVTGAELKAAVGGLQSIAKYEVSERRASGNVENVNVLRIKIAADFYVGEAKLDFQRVFVVGDAEVVEYDGQCPHGSLGVEVDTDGVVGRRQPLRHIDRCAYSR